MNNFPSNIESQFAAEAKLRENLKKIVVSPDWYVERKPWRPGERHV